VLQNSVSGNQVKFPFNAASNKCVAVANNGALVEVRSCDVPSAVWIEHLGPDGVSCIFQNQQFGLYLSGPDNGGQFHLETKGANGWLQQFHLFNGLSSAVCS
jgi:hypothetical protein